MSVILAIDDDRVTLHLIEQQLTALKYRVITADSAHRGLESAKTINPDLILLDIEMPEMNGFQVLENLQKDELTAGIPVIMLTALKKKEVVVSAMQHGVVDYITKPYKLEYLQQKLTAGLRFSRLKKQETQLADSEVIMISQDSDSAIISFKIALKNKSFLAESQKIFNAFFFRQIKNKVCIIDLRPLPVFDEADAKILSIIIRLFGTKELLLVAGRHYGTIAAEVNYGDNVELFISYGDMTVFKNKLQASR